MIKNHNNDTKHAAAEPYDNNPLLLAVRGIERLFTYAKPVALTLLVASLLFAVLNFSSMFAPTPTESTPANQGEVAPMDSSVIEAIAIAPLGLAVLLLVISLVLLATLLYGIADYTAAATADGRKTTVSEAFAATCAHFWPYLLIRLLVFVKIILWSLLFILPGIYFGYRYVLSGVAFFSEGKRGNSAIKRSLQLTDGAWLTTFVSYGLLNLLTLGSIQALSDTGTGAELYKNYRSTIDAGRAHPSAHIASWLAVIFALAIIVLFIFAGILFGIGTAL